MTPPAAPLRLRWVATCARGLEEILRAELHAEGFALGTATSGRRDPASETEDSIRGERESGRTDQERKDREKDKDSIRERRKEGRRKVGARSPREEPLEARRGAPVEAAEGGRRDGGAIGGVTFVGDLAIGVRANWRLRTANRVLLEIASWPARDDEELYQGAYRLLASQPPPGRNPPASPPQPIGGPASPAPSTSSPSSTPSSFPFNESFSSSFPFNESSSSSSSISTSSSSSPPPSTASGGRRPPDAVALLAGWLTPERTFAITATSSRSAIRDTRWIALKVKDALVDAQRSRFGSRSSVAREEPDLALRLRLHGGVATLLVDTSGDPLDRRGYRVASAAAPLREQLAAAAILASGWDGRGPVVDPMCGSGTLLAEAGAISAGLAANRLRPRWGFERLPGFEGLLASVRSEPLPAPDPASELFGVDLDPDAVAAARLDLRAAGLEERARLAVGDGLDFQPPPGPGLVAVNPPYGERLTAGDELWRRLGDLLKQRFRGWRAVVVAGDPELGRRIGLRPARRIPVWNGPLEARILVFELY